MNTHKRRILAAALSIAALGLPATVQAQEWAPTKPVRIIVPIVGSTNDVLARMLSPKLQEALGQPVIVENKPAPAATLAPTWWPRRHPMAIPC